MKIDLLKIFENNKKIDEERAKIKQKEELNKIIAAIIKNDDYYYCDDKELIEKIGIKIKNKKRPNPYVYNYTYNYVVNGITCHTNEDSFKIELNKTNIKKIQNYIDKGEEE